jgi:hypothetical protein
VVASRDGCCRVVHRKVSSGDRERLDKYFLREELYVALTSTHNGKSGMDGLSCEFYKPCGTPLMITFMLGF